MINQELKLWDPSLKEFKLVVKNCPEFLKKIENWFYMANDEITSEKEGYVFWVEGRKRLLDDSTRCDSGAAVIELTPYVKYPLTHAMRSQNYLEFNLFEGKEQAFFAKINVGGKNKYFLVIKNNNYSFSFPYSNKGISSYKEAIKESGSLANYINSGKILTFLPEKYLKMTGIEIGISK